ncbi:uncharacterized protein LOC119372373 [Rhipicephalus sanguineus]|uniref:uncharacterized protein LOC119372373 n=1 Tax=Rhipicephalus sanguineus TaxID=34632 RepID=UPI001895AEA1|nr:uncharacterized protein LOC119372373 [Rhipicephalus sanguineus]
MPEDVFDGISKLVARLKKPKLPKTTGEEGVPLLPSSKSSPAGTPEESNEDDGDDQSVVFYDEDTSKLPKTTGEDGVPLLPSSKSPSAGTPEESNEDDGDDQSVVFYDEDTSQNATEDAPQISPVRPPRHPKGPGVSGLGSASGDDAFLDPKQTLGERDGSSPEKASPGSDVAVAGSPEEDWFSSGRRRWIGRYDVTVARTSKYEKRRLQTTAALSDGRCSELSGSGSSLPEQRATYDLFVERWSSSATADAASDVSFLSDDTLNCPMGQNVDGSFSSNSGGSSKGLRETQFHRGPLKRPPRSSGTSAKSHSSSEHDVSGSAPTWKFLSGPHEEKRVQKPANHDVQVASAKNLNPSSRAGEKLIEARRNDHKKINSDKAEVVGWFDDVSSESGE